MGYPSYEKASLSALQSVSKDRFSTKQRVPSKFSRNSGPCDDGHCSSLEPSNPAPAGLGAPHRKQSMREAKTGDAPHSPQVQSPCLKSGPCDDGHCSRWDWGRRAPPPELPDRGAPHLKHSVRRAKLGEAPHISQVQSPGFIICIWTAAARAGSIRI